MNKKSVFTIFFTIFAIGIFLFIVNEYLKRVEKDAIETYLSSIKNEFVEYSLNMEANPVVCRGFIKHKCGIDNIKIYNKDTEITLQNASATITNISNNDIGVKFSIDEITYNSHTNPYLVLLPKKFIYMLNLKKQDSRLGYVLLNRSIYLDFSYFSIDINLDILLREKVFRDKNILALLREWLDSNTPSFYEYSLDTLSLKALAEEINTSNHNLSASLKLLINKAKATLPKDKALFHNNLVGDYFNRLINDSYDLLDNKIDSITLNISRKNPDITFFNLLSDEAAVKKILEIIEVVNSINETYNIKLDIKNAKL